MQFSYYCEYHRNIRTTHITIRIPTTEFELSHYDRKTLRLRYGFTTQSIALPASVDVTKQLQWSIADGVITCRVPADPIIEPRHDIPLDKSDLSTDLSCLRCNTVIVHGGSLEWSLLPSDHWLETMDSWHCHRGVTDHRHHDHALPDHIVSAVESITPRPGVGLLGVTHLLVHDQDVSFSESP